MRSLLLLLLVTNIFSQHLRVDDSKGASSGGSWVGFLLGPLLFVLAFPIIWYNERKASINYKHLTEAQKICRSYGDVVHIPPGELIHISGRSVTNEVLRDHITGLSVNNAIKLMIEVEVK